MSANLLLKTGWMKVSFKLFNTLSRQTEVFEAPDNSVRMYTCGPTVYGYPHIGNHRTYIFEDVLVKTLRLLGFTVKRVMNITDVGHLTDDADAGEDKLEVGARRDGTTAWEVAKKYEAAFIDDMHKLNLDIPDQLVRATDTIAGQIAMIQMLADKGYTYTTGDGVYFDTSKLSDYGKLAKLDIEGLQAGARVDLGEKRSITDFALWKFSPTDQKRDMEWESPWGIGFPGWHIECSAIIRETLGDQIDIHCGGVDHIPVHHTNEIAQSEAATGKMPMSRFWAHSEFLMIDGGKMSKSLGNLYTMADIEAKGIEPVAFKLFCLSASYRSKLNFSWEALQSAQTTLINLRKAYAADGGEESDLDQYKALFTEALADDLNTAAALAVIWKSVALQKDLRQEFFRFVDTVFGLNLDQPGATKEVTPEVQSLIEQRNQARAAKNWSEADALRHQIEALGFQVKDSENGTEVL